MEGQPQYGSKSTFAKVLAPVLGYLGLARLSSAQPGLSWLGLDWLSARLGEDHRLQQLGSAQARLASPRLAQLR